MTTPTLEMIEVAKLRPREDNLRTVVDGSDLVPSILQQGLITPLNVSPGPDGTYLVNAGHRRLDAAKKAKLKTVPCLVVETTDELVLTTMVVENLMRVDLSPIEEAEGYAQLKALGVSQKEISKRIGVSTAVVSRRLALLTLPEQVRSLVEKGKITLDAADALVALAKLDPEECIKYVNAGDLEDLERGEIEYHIRRVATMHEIVRVTELFTEGGVPVVSQGAEWRRAYDKDDNAIMLDPTPLAVAAAAKKGYAVQVLRGFNGSDLVHCYALERRPEKEKDTPTSSSPGGTTEAERNRANKEKMAKAMATVALGLSTSTATELAHFVAEAVWEQASLVDREKAAKLLGLTPQDRKVGDQVVKNYVEPLAELFDKGGKAQAKVAAALVAVRNINLHYTPAWIEGWLEDWQ